MEEIPELGATTTDIPPRDSMSELEWLSLEQEKEFMLAAMNASLNDYSNSSIQQDGHEAPLLDSQSPPAAESRPSVRTMEFLVEEQEREMLLAAMNESLNDHSHSSIQQDGHEDPLLDSQSPPAAASRPSVRTMEFLVEEQEREMLEMALRTSLTEEVTKGEGANSVSLNDDQAAAMNESMNIHSHSSIQQDGHEAPLLDSQSPPAASSRHSVRTMEFLVEEQEREMLEMALRSSLTQEDTKGEGANAFSLNDDQAVREKSQPPSVAGRTSVRTQAFLIEEQEREMVEMAVRLSVSDDNNNPNSSGLASKDQDDSNINLAKKEGAAKSRTSLRTLQLLVEENEKEMLEVAMERSLLLRDDTNINEPVEGTKNQQADEDKFDEIQQVAQQRREEPATNHHSVRPHYTGPMTTPVPGPPKDNVSFMPSRTKTTASPSHPPEKEDDFYVMQVIQERARQAALEEATGPSLEVPQTPHLPSQDTKRQENESTRGLATLLSNSSPANFGVEAPNPSLPQEKEDNFHVMQVVRERARQAAALEGACPSSHEEGSHQASQSNKTSGKAKLPSLGGVRPGAYSGAPGKDFQRTNALRYSLVGLASKDNGT